MKIKNIITVLLVAFILASCAPAVTVVPTETAAPSSTFTPAPTATATITPAPAPENLVDVQDLPTWIANYVNAYGGKITVNGAEMDSTQLLNVIKSNPSAFTQAKQIKGAKYSFFVVNNTPIASRKNGNLKWTKTSLRLIADGIDFKIGSIISSPYAPDMELIDKFIIQEFNLATLEQLSAAQTEPSKGIFTFLNTDGSANENSLSEKAVALSVKNNMTVQGNDLVYGNADFQWGWAKDFKDAPSDAVDQAMKEHIIAVMTHFKGRITQWTVANEVLPKSWHPGFWDPYVEILGDDYFVTAFKTARQTDPTAVLIYNQGLNEIIESQRFETTLQNLKKLRNETITLDNGKTMPLVDTVGLQMHLDGSRPPTKPQLVLAFKAYAETGVSIAITEMDVDLSKVNGTDQERFAKQAKIYKDVFEACLESKVCNEINFWGVGDKYSWLVRDNPDKHIDPTILNNDLTPKQAYYEIIQVLYNHLP